MVLFALRRVKKQRYAPPSQGRIARPWPMASECAVFALPSDLGRQAHKA